VGDDTSKTIVNEPFDLLGNFVKEQLAKRSLEEDDQDVSNLVSAVDEFGKPAFRSFENDIGDGRRHRGGFERVLQDFTPAVEHEANVVDAVELAQQDANQDETNLLVRSRRRR